MTDDDLERRLRTALGGRAERVESELSGPQLRARAAGAQRPVTRFAAPVLAAAAVIVVAVAIQAVGHDGGHHPRQAPGGRPSITQPVHPRTMLVPSPHPTSSATVDRPQRPSPTRTGVRVPPAPSRPPSASRSQAIRTVAPTSRLRAPSAQRTSTPRPPPHGASTGP